MSQIEKFEPIATMSSREIAELTGKRHDNVKRTIETLVESGVIVRPQIEDEQSPDAMGRPRIMQVYNLDKRSSLIVVAQLCPEFTARIIDRWQQLEAAAHDPFGGFKVPRTLNEALRLALDLSDKVEEQAAQIEVMKPKAEFHDRVATAINALSIDEAAKSFGTGSIRLFRMLRQHGYLKSNNAPYQQYENQNLFRVIQVTRKIKGEDVIFPKTLITGKGMTVIQRDLGLSRTPDLFH